MAKSNQNPDPYLQLIAEWEEVKILAKRYTEREAIMRKQLFDGAFPDPKEGVNTHELPDGRKVKGTHKINRTVDEAAVASTLALLREQGVANADKLVRYKPELAITEWKSLSPEMKLLFSPVLVSRPGSPTLEIVAAKGQ